MTMKVKSSFFTLLKFTNWVGFVSTVVFIDFHWKRILVGEVSSVSLTWMAFQFWKEELPHGYRLILIQPYINNLLSESSHVFLWMHTQTSYILLESLYLRLRRNCDLTKQNDMFFLKKMVITLLNMTTHKIIICFMWFISFQLSLCINTRSLYEVMCHIFPWNFRKGIDIFNPIVSETVWIEMCFFTFERKLFTGS